VKTPLEFGVARYNYAISKNKIKIFGIFPDYDMPRGGGG
jgi:hypothetical protein